MRKASIAAIRKIREGGILAVINTEIIQEILYRFQSIKKLPIGIQLSREAILISYQILSVTQKDISLAIELLESHPKVETRDAFHAATMINNNIKEIISTDSHFDLIPQIQRIDPKKLNNRIIY